MSHIRSRASRLLFAMLASAPVACAAPGHVEPSSTAMRATVRVQNDSPRSIVVYLIANDTKLLLGTVGSMESRAFAITDAYLFEARTYSLSALEHGGSDGPRSSAFPLRSGMTATWKVSIGPGSPLVAIQEHR